MRLETLFAGLCAAAVEIGIAGRALLIRCADGTDVHQRSVEPPPVAAVATGDFTGRPRDTG